MCIRHLSENEIERFAIFEKLHAKDEEQISNFIHSYNYDVYVYEVDSQWEAYLVVHQLDHGVWDLIHIHTQVQHRRKNRASKLLTYFQKEVYVKTMTLEVAENNQSAIRFYKRHNFQIEAIRKNYYKTGNGVLMSKQIEYILAIETSCDETAAAIVSSDFQIVSNIIHTQIVHEQYGGVVPEVASREHVEQLPVVIQKAIDKAGLEYTDIDYIAVTYGPGLAGSLMIGVEAAKTLGLQLQIPVIAINHMAGHIYANKGMQPFKYPLLAITISGGHTEIVEMLGEDQFTIISQTHDDAIGEVYDKVARVLGLGYPGGPKVAALADRGIPECDFPIAQVKGDPYGMSFSGLKTAVINHVHKKKQRNETINIENVAHSFQAAIVKTLEEKLRLCMKRQKYQHILMAGGVSANTVIQKSIREIAFENKIAFSVPPTLLCTDNAAMIGLAACVKIQNNEVQNSEKIQIQPGLVLQ